LDTAEHSRDQILKLQNQLSSRDLQPVQHSDRVEGICTPDPAVLKSIADAAVSNQPADMAVLRDAMLRLPFEQSTREQRQLWMQLDHESDASKQVWLDRIESQRNRSHSIESNTVMDWQKKYFKSRKQQSDTGKLSAGRLSAETNAIKYFCNWIGTSTLVEKITAYSLAEFHSTLMDRIGEDTISQSYASDQIKSVKRFVRWMWEQDAIQSLPKNIESKSLQIQVDTKTPGSLTLREIAQLCAVGSGRPLLYVLLGLNCGTTQKEVSDFQDTEVCWKTGRITRKRTKTKRSKRVPVVTHKLWPITFELLKKYRNNDSKYVLTNENGLPLVRDEIGADGKYRKSDNIKNAFSRLAKEASVKASFKLLRKTAANLLYNHKDHRQFAELFLAHAPKTTAEKHYVSPNENTLDDSVDFLWQQLKESISPSKESLSQETGLNTVVEEAANNHALVVDLSTKQFFWKQAKFEGKLPAQLWEFFSTLAEARKCWNRGIFADDLSCSPLALKSQKKRLYDKLVIQFEELANRIKPSQKGYELELSPTDVAVFSRTKSEAISELTSIEAGAPPISVDMR
jgi:hypothetical protein